MLSLAQLSPSLFQYLFHQITHILIRNHINVCIQHLLLTGVCVCVCVCVCVFRKGVVVTSWPRIGEISIFGLDKTLLDGLNDAVRSCSTCSPCHQNFLRLHPQTVIVRTHPGTVIVRTHSHTVIVRTHPQTVFVRMQHQTVIFRIHSQTIIVRTYPQTAILRTYPEALIVMTHPQTIIVMSPSVIVRLHNYHWPFQQSYII